MLRLSGRSAQRIGTAYVCTSCLAAPRSTRPLTPRRPTFILSSYHGRPLSSTCHRPAPTVETSTTHHDGVENIKLPESEAPKKKKNKRKQKKANAQPESPPSPRTPPPSKKTVAENESARQLQVLQGALQALKNVLTAQNIDVDQIVKSTNQISHKGLESKTKPKVTAKSSTKPNKSKKKKAQTSQDVTPEPTSTPEAVPTEPSSTSAPVGRSRRAALRKSAKQPKSKAKAASKKSTTKAQNKPAKPGVHAVQEELHGHYAIIGQPFTSESQPKTAAPSKKASKSQKSQPLAIQKIHTKDLNVVPIEAEHPPVPSLSYGLERVLFNPGVYFLQDPRSRVYNFDPYLSEIMPIQEFDFNALKQYVTSSKDSTLIRIAKENRKRYTGSTSSMTSMLSHFHYLLSSWREINTGMLSRSFSPESVQFTRIMRGPAAIFLHWKDGTYAIDADKEYDTANILSMLGKSMEKLLTLTKEEYERYRHVNSAQISEEERNAEEAFHYTGFRDFMMRSQLDAHDPRIPGSGMFDLKTRAVVSIRMDAKGFHKGLGYEIRSRFGQWESFEREYYDMIRSAFLKYSLQVRMGRMDGIFVAFHNTQRIFGFQYIPLSEMDLALHGTTNTTLGHWEYKSSLTLLNDILDRVTKRFPERSLRMHFETRTSVGAPFMYIFAKPVTAKDIEEVQNASKASIEAFEKDILGLAKDEAEAEYESAVENDDVAEDEGDVEESSPVQESSSLSAWNEVRQMVEDAVDDDEVGVGAVREAIEDALEQSGLLHAKSSIEARGYVDALLGAITSSKSPHTEPPADVPSDDTITHENDLSPSTPELETSAAEQPVSDDELNAGESQVHDVPVEQPKETGEQVDNKQLAEPESIIEQDGQPSTTTSSIEDEARKTEETLDDDVPEQAPVTEAQVEEIPGESTKLTAEPTPEEESTIEEEENEDEDEEAEDEDDEIEAGESKSTSSMSPLKNLILEMAQRIDERAVSDQVESSLEDSSKLKEFERILGELMARSKDEQLKQKDNGSPAMDNQPESEDQSQAETKGPQVVDISNTENSTQQAPSEASTEEPKPTEEKPDEELLGLVLTIKNKVNGKYVTRPEDLTKHDSWIVEYNIEEISGKRAQTIYQQCKSRRKKVFEDTGDKETEWYKMFKGDLEKHTKSGRKFRAAETQKARRFPVYIIGQQPLQWEDVFGKQQGTSEPLDEDKEDVDDDSEREGCRL
ncbi:Pet127-domain-containing protein [Hypoxylon sp. EC38]|nr:Pet127-domain-containing protein [Hypoxylon sp. EC38]